MTNLPWAPLMTVTRSGLPEVTLHGIIYAGRGDGETLISVGEADTPIWSRSLLKPFQLLPSLPILMSHYPWLESRHLALMLSSHNGEAAHLKVLHEILEKSGLPESVLQCAACLSLSDAVAFEKRAQGMAPSSLQHPCSGKHLGFLLALQAQGQGKDLKALNNYLEHSHTLYTEQRELLALLLGREANDFQVSIDGCGMPNLALTAQEMAHLYALMTQPLSERILANASALLRPVLEAWPTLASVMQAHPDLVGGSARLDSRLLSQEKALNDNPRVIAKEGADGLLAVAITPASDKEPPVGLLIKVASGYDAGHLETLLDGTLAALGWLTPSSEVASVTKRVFHFSQLSSALEPRR